MVKPHTSTRIIMFEETEVKGKSDIIDRHVGMRLKQKRLLLGMTQEDLGIAVNVSIQQIQKYEKATNRIASGKLYAFANLLRVPVSYFFQTDDQNNDIWIAESKSELEISEDRADPQEVLTLVRSYSKIKDNDSRKKTLYLIKTLSVTQLA